MNGTYLQGREKAKELLMEGKENIIKYMLEPEELFNLCRIFGENWVKGFKDVVA